MIRSPHHLSSKTVDQITTVLARFPMVESAVLFGSRAKGNHKPGSDIDLALSGDARDWRAVGQLYDTFDDLLLPYDFSLIVLDETTDVDVAAHISRVGIPLYSRELEAAK
mgnify:CR=1 FL=1